MTVHRNRSHLILDLPSQHHPSVEVLVAQNLEEQNPHKFPKQKLRTSYLRSSSSLEAKALAPAVVHAEVETLRKGAGLGRRLSEDLNSTIDSIRQVIGSVRSRLVNAKSIDSWANIPFILEGDGGDNETEPKPRLRPKLLQGRSLLTSRSHSTSTDESEASAGPCSRNPTKSHKLRPKTHKDVGVEGSQLKPSSGSDSSATSRTQIARPRLQRRVGLSLSVSMSSDVDDKTLSSCPVLSRSEYTLRHPKRALGTRSLSSETAPEEKAGKYPFPILILTIP
jgi:hypothetical protein